VVVLRCWQDVVTGRSLASVAGCGHYERVEDSGEMDVNVDANECVMVEQAMWELDNLVLWTWCSRRSADCQKGTPRRKDDSITDCHMLVKMDFQCLCCAVPWPCTTTPHLHNQCIIQGSRWDTSLTGTPRSNFQGWKEATLSTMPKVAAEISPVISARSLPRAVTPGQSQI